MLIFVLVIRMFSKFDLPRQAGSKLKSQLEVKNFILFIYFFWLCRCDRNLLIFKKIKNNDRQPNIPMLTYSQWAAGWIYSYLFIILFVYFF